MGKEMNRWLNKNLIYNPTVLISGEWFYHVLDEMNKFQWLSLDSINEYQEHRLNNIIRIAKKKTQFYHNIPCEVNLFNYHRVPFLDKTTLRKKSSLIRGVRSPFDRIKTSGGSTGAPLTVIKNPRAMAAELSAAWRGYSWAGVNVGDKQGRFWGVPQSSWRNKIRANLIDFACNRYRVSAFGLNSNTWIKAIESLQKFNPDYFYGYVSIILEFAKFLKKEDRNFRIKPKSIITTSEVLTVADRNYVENVFKCRVFNEYGCGEVGTIAHECELGSLHVNSENLILEIVDESGSPLSPGNVGEIVVTDLNNIAMPLIRYKLSDWGLISSKQCKCGRGLPVIEKLYGRAYDILINSHGQSFHGEFFLYILEDAKKYGLDVDGVQFIQTKSGNIDIKLVCKDEIFNKLRILLVERLKTGFDKYCKIRIDKVSLIEREPSGKLRVVKRE
jgi:phenylacetate-CoA ligase